MSLKMTVMGAGREEGREGGGKEKASETTSLVVICLFPRVTIVFLEILQ